MCIKNRTKRYLHPIIDWSSSDVWDYIRSRNIPYCSLYNEGFKRIGCVLCPMTRNTAQQIARWPKIAKAYENAIKKTFKPDRKEFKFTNEQEYWEWWLDRDAKSLREDKEQMLIFED